MTAFGCIADVRFEQRPIFDKKPRTSTPFRENHRTSDRPNNQVIAYRGFGDLYKRKGNLKASERWYRKAVEEKGDKAWDLICLGGVLARQGKFAEAKKYHRRATRIKSENRDEAYLKLGLIFRAERKYANAIKCFDKAMKGEPKYKAAKRARRDVIAAMEIRNRR